MTPMVTGEGNVIRGRGRTAIAILLGVAVAAAVVGASTYMAVTAPFSAELRVVSLGWWYGDNTSGRLVNLSLNYSSPSLLQASNLGFVIVGPVTLWNGSIIRNLEVPYSAHSYPPWLSMPASNSYWTGYSITAMNPDGGQVAGFLPAGGYPVTYVESGAVFSMEVPGYASPAGLTISVTYLGHPGSAEVVVP